MTDAKLLLEKKNIIEELLLAESMMVHVRADQEDCKLPSHLKPLRTVSIKLSHYFSRPLFIDEKKISIELSFDNVFFPCEIPFSAIWACTSFEGRHTFWSEGLPDDLLEIMQEVQKNSPPESSEQKSNISKLPLSSVKTQKSGQQKTKAKSGTAKVSHLTLVKK
jgi:hypothetical protein